MSAPDVARTVRLEIVIPVVNEGTKLAAGVTQLLNLLPGELRARIVVNGDDPETLRIVQELCARHALVAALYFPRRMGKGRAVFAGLQAAAAELLGFLDADFPFEQADLGKMLDELEHGVADCVIASKWLGRGYGQVESYTLRSKKLLSRGLNLITRFAFGLPFADTQGGTKLFTSAAWQAVNAPYSCGGFAFDVELLQRLIGRGLRVRERFARQRPSYRSTFNLRELARMAWELARLRWLLWVNPHYS